MARARNIKPSFFKNELLVEMGPFDRLLFIGLWCLADREGRTEDRPKRIKMELFPCDTYDVEQGLADLQRGGFIKRYEAAGVRVISIVNFLKHQTPHGTEKDSQLPDEDGELTVNERQSNGYATGKKRKNNVKTAEDNVDPPLDNGEPSVKTQAKNTLNPDSLIPDSLNTPPTPPGGAPDGAGGVDQAFPSLPDEPEVLEALPTSAGTACTTAGAACLALKAAGIADTNPSSPKLRALLTAGADLQEFIGAAQAAVAAGNGRFAYVLAAVAGERERAAKLASKLHQGQMPVAETPYQRSMRERVQQFAPSIARKAPEAKTQSAVEFFNAIEVPTRTVGAIE